MIFGKRTFLKLLKAKNNFSNLLFFKKLQNIFNYELDFIKISFFIFGNFQKSNGLLLKILFQKSDILYDIS